MSIKSLNALAVLAVLAASVATSQDTLAGGTRVQMMAGNNLSAKAATMKFQAKRLKGGTSQPNLGKLANPGGGRTGGTFHPQAGNNKFAVGGIDPTPHWRQTSGYRSLVNMEHASCGADCFEHVLANENGNKIMKGVISMHCPIGKEVQHLYYTVGDDGGIPPLVTNPTGTSSVSFNVEIEPWTADFFEHTGQNQFGGEWSGNIDNNNNTSATAETTLHQSVKVIGECTNSNDNSVVEEFQVDSTTKFVDLDF